MANNFAAWWAFCQTYDGQQNDTSPGGVATHWGFQYGTYVTAMKYVNPSAPGATMAQFNAATQADMQNLAEKFYWERLQGPALPAGADIEVVDWCFGSGGAPRQIQQMVGVPVDGIIGPATAAAIAKYPSFITACYAARVAYYNSLANHAEYPGWYRRAQECQALALQVAAAVAPVPTPAPTPTPTPTPAPTAPVFTVTLSTPNGIAKGSQIIINVQ